MKDGLSADDLNRNVALGFLESLKKRKSDELLLADDKVNLVNPIFKKPNERSDFPVQKDNSSSVHSGLTHVMDTFEFGESASNSNRLTKTRNINPPIVNKVNLDYNYDDVNECSSGGTDDTSTVAPIIFKKIISNKKFRKRIDNDNLDES